MDSVYCIVMSQIGDYRLALGRLGYQCRFGIIMQLLDGQEGWTGLIFERFPVHSEIL